MPVLAPRGWRVKHRLAPNQIELYDKADVLRGRDDGQRPQPIPAPAPNERAPRLVPDAQGVSNLRRYQVAGAADERYLEALAAASETRHGIAVVDRHMRPITDRGRGHPRLNPVNRDELALYRAGLAGEHTIVGFRNTHLLYDAASIRTRPAASGKPAVAAPASHG